MDNRNHRHYFIFIYTKPHFSTFFFLLLPSGFDVPVQHWDEVNITLRSKGLSHLMGLTHEKNYVHCVFITIYVQ